MSRSSGASGFSPTAGGGRTSRRGEAGAALVELALALTILCTLLFGVITFGFMLAVQQTVSEAAAEGARAAVTAVQNGPEDQPILFALNQAGTSTRWLGSSGPCPRVDPPAGPPPGTFLSCGTEILPCGSNQKCLTVTVTYDWHARPLIPTLPFMGSVLNGGPQIKSKYTVALAGPCATVANGLCSP